MDEKLVSVNKLIGTRIIGGKHIPHRVGNVKDILFHPTKKRAVGIVMRRSDLLWMFKRKDRFIAIDSCYLADKRIYIDNGTCATGKAAYKALGLEKGSCVVWAELPVVTKSGQEYGVVVDVSFDFNTGKVHSLESGSSSLDSFMFGRRTIPTDLIKGYRSSDNADDIVFGSGGGVDDEDYFEAILVSGKVSSIEVEDGLSKRVGKGAAVIADKAGKVGKKASNTAKAAAVVTGTIITDASIATGKQIQKTKGMFSSFKNEYKKARHE